MGNKYNLFARTKNKEQSILRSIAQGLSPIEAAKRHGEPRVSVRLEELLVSPRIVGVIEKHVNMLIRGQDKARARAVLAAIMENEKVSANVRVQAARSLLEAAFSLAEAEPAATQAPSEMSAHQLREFIEKMQEEMNARANAAKLIEGSCEPVNPDNNSQLTDLLG